MDLNRIQEAVALLSDCARALQRSGGMLNADLARDAVKLASVLAAELAAAPESQPAPFEGA